MKLKNILRDIREKWVASTEYLNEYVEIFKNPSKKEIIDLKSESEDVRFIALEGEGDVYVTHSFMFHPDLAEELGINEDYKDNFSGIGRIDRGVIIAYALSDVINLRKDKYNNLKEKILNGDYDWVERYNFDLSTIKENLSREEE